jgi:hypothetical protein
VSLIEEPHKSLGGRQGVERVHGFLVDKLLRSLREKVKGRKCSLIFDGSKVNILVEALLIRFLDDSCNIQQLVVGVKELVDSLNAAALKDLIQNHMAEAEIHLRDVVAFMSDSGQPNPSMMKEWNSTIGRTCVGQELIQKSILWLPCLMHGFSNCGLVLRKSLPALKLFMSGYKKMSNTSDAARKLWVLVCGQSCQRLADKTFWKWWMCCKSVLSVFDRVWDFLRQAKTRELCPKSIQKMDQAYGKMGERGYLHGQLQFCVSFGSPFFHAGYQLEGDGFCLPFVQHHISTLLRMEADLFHNQANWGEVQTPVRTAHEKFSMYPEQQRRLEKCLFDSAKNVFEQFKNAIVTKMADVIPLYRAAGVFHPPRLFQELAREEKDEFGRVLDEMSKFILRVKEVLSFFKKCFLGEAEASIVAAITGEYAEYVRSARLLKDAFTEQAREDSPQELWKWWREIASNVPKLFSIASVLVLAQPSSAAIERFYSKVKANTDATQGGEFEETFAARTMALYNRTN